MIRPERIRDSKRILWTIGSAIYKIGLYISKTGRDLSIDCANCLQEFTSPNQVSANKRAKSSTYELPTWSFL
jgi:hypothetical protein